jgi:hypothetical protein
MGSGSGSFELAETLASHSFDLTLDNLSKYGLFTFSMYPMFEHLVLYSLLWGQLCERVTVTDVCRLYNFYEHVITQQLISD